MKMEWTPDVAWNAVMTVGDEDTPSGNHIQVFIQLKDYAGNDMKVRSGILAYLAEDATGDVAEAATGTVDISGDGLLVELASNLTFLLVSESDGDIRVDVENSGTDDLYLILIMPNGKLVASPKLAFTT